MIVNTKHIFILFRKIKWKSSVLKYVTC